MKAPSQDKSGARAGRRILKDWLLKAEKFKKPTSKELRRYTKGVLALKLSRTYFGDRGLRTS